jgi:hypothetical protein
MSSENDRLDNLMDRALASYTPTQPRSGLEQRILASVASASRRHTWAWRTVWALAAAATLLAVIVIPVRSRFPHTESAVVHPATAAPPAIIEQHPSSLAVSARVHQARRPVAAQRTPAAAESVVSETASKSRPAFIATLTIAPIRNQPLADKAIASKPITIAPIQIAALN